MKAIDLPDGLGLRMETASDRPFISSLFHQVRSHFYLAEQESDYIHQVIDHQLELQTQGYGNQAPNAVSMIILKTGTPIGRIVLDFGNNIAHLLDIALIQEVRNKGYGTSVIQAIQHVAQKQMLPVGLSVEHQNPTAKSLYQTLGFRPVERTATHDFMMWYPIPC
ncbi:GNAT family N-acetyltransferase [Saccharospirillum salsuginis]|uniref:N-acetyltransferase domain-containing protein n=1 Tax=Saccharospirillum salsuginis TaxID=418750 RepID=A0A918K7K7_9GAMM|nr:GNAT family N-acetyltransferase [Saccharospirillum salsuginis]GGX49910.1 hypothetical protein GCM10007392_16630 [Saccharospirillum salsuginis]